FIISTGANLYHDLHYALNFTLRRGSPFLDVEERRTAAEGEIERVMKVVIQVRAGRDDEIDQAAVHHLDDAAAEAGWRERAGDGQADRRVVRRIEHLVGENLCSFGQPAGVERLKTLVDQMTDFLAPFGTVIPDWLAGQERLTG